MIKTGNKEATLDPGGDKVDVVSEQPLTSTTSNTRHKEQQQYIVCRLSQAQARQQLSQTL